MIRYLVLAKKHNLYILNIGLILIVWLNLNSIEYGMTNFLTEYTKFYSVDWSDRIIPLSILALILLLSVTATIIKFEYKQPIREDKEYSLLWILAFYIYYIIRGRSGFITDEFIYYAAYIKVFDFKVVILDVYMSIFLLFYIGPFLIKLNKSNNSIFINDTPRAVHEPDLFHRHKILEELSHQINRFYDENYSFVIGIEGKWGSGKTTFIDELESSFLNNEQYTIIRPNPWQYQSPQEILKGFFDDLSDKLLKTSGLKSKHLKGYIHSILNENKVLSIFSKIGGARNSDFYKSALNDDIIQSQIKIIVIIDDLDRLDTDELKLVLNIIRNIGNLANTIFVVAYDKLQVLSILDNDEALSKFIQVEISLGVIENGFIVKYLEDELEKRFPNEIEAYNKSNKLIADTSMTSISNPSNFQNTSALMLLRNKRDAIRLLNNFSLQYSLLKETVNFTDFLFLSIIKLKFPIIYQKIKDKEIFNPDPFTEFYEISDYSQFGPTTDRILEEMLFFLFPSNQDARQINKISKKEYFDVYFKNEPYNELNLTELKAVFDV